MDPTLLFPILQAMGVARQDGTRLDAGETGFIAKQLEFVMARTYDVQRAPALARKLIPVDTSVPSGAETFAYDQWDTVGLAKLIANYADDLPNVDAFVKRFPAQIRGVGNSYTYTLQDIRAIQMSRGRLNEMRAFAARDGFERTIDFLAAFGDEAAGLKGFLNHDAVPLVPVINGAWTEATSPEDIFEDLNELVNAPVIATKTLYEPDTLLVDTQSFGLLQRPIGSDFTTTILRAFLNTNPYIKNVQQWTYLDTADDDGTGRRLMVYKRDPVVVHLVIPQDFEQMPPQPKNLAFSVPTHGRIGGVTFHYPLAAAYMDLDASEG